MNNYLAFHLIGTLLLLVSALLNKKKTISLADLILYVLMGPVAYILIAFILLAFASDINIVNRKDD
jgi:hypothetical protein